MKTRFSSLYNLSLLLCLASILVSNCQSNQGNKVPSHPDKRVSESDQGHKPQSQPVIIVSDPDQENKVQNQKDICVSESDVYKQIMVEGLCNRISSIKEMPPKRDFPVNDPIYTGIISMDKAMLPCLVDKMTDTSLMTDPRQNPEHFTNIALGDVAFFLIDDIVDINFEELFPPEVSAQFSTRGFYYAYHDYITSDENARNLLKARVLELLQKKGLLKKESQ